MVLLDSFSLVTLSRSIARECTTHMNSGKLWCPTQLDHLNGYIEDMWGNCDPDTCTGCR